MFINKARDGKNNVCGANIRALRMKMTPKLSQRALADRMQKIGLDLDKNAIQRIESRARFVTDIELVGFARVLEVPVEALIDESLMPG
nr:helix-turn-helix transcriptional regulator [Maliibacterium massiliense]